MVLLQTITILIFSFCFLGIPELAGLLGFPSRSRTECLVIKCHYGQILFLSPRKFKALATTKENNGYRLA